LKRLNLCMLAKIEQEKTKSGITIVNSTNPEDPLGSCGCGCFWAGQGGSSNDHNEAANSSKSLWSKYP